LSSLGNKEGPALDGEGPGVKPLSFGVSSAGPFLL